GDHGRRPDRGLPGRRRRHHRKRLSAAGRGPAGLRLDQQPRPRRDQERRHPVHDPRARRQPAGRCRLRAARSAAARDGVNTFGARAARHPGFQVGALLLVLFIGTALLSAVWTPYAVDALQMRSKLLPASAEHLLGTDHLGRDVLSRIMVGARTSLAVGLIAVGLGMLAGVTLGAWAAARGGWVDEMLSRASDLVFAFPAV